MSRLPTTSQIATTPRRLSRQPSLDLRKRKTISENVPPVPTLTKARSRSFIGDQQHTYTALNTPRSSLISPTALPTTTTQPSGPPYIGDRVAVDSMGIVGTLKFLGEAEFKEGYWAGIQLDIIGSGKNDGSVKGTRYFSCPANTGLFVLANKLSSLDGDSDSVRSLSPPAARLSLSMDNPSSRAARYIGMTANQLVQTTSPKKKTRTPLSVRSTSTSSLNTPLTSPVSANRNSLRRSQPLVQSPTPTHHYNRSIPSPAMTPTHHADNTDDYYLLSDDNSMLITDTPIPENLALSKSLTTANNMHSPSTSSSSSSESPHERLERVMGEAISQAPDETVMRLQQLQLRVQVLEAENKFLKLENTQNKTAEQILERSMVLNPKEGELFTLEGHKTIVAEIKQAHALEQSTWTEQQVTTQQAIQRLETKVLQLEAEQVSLQTERDKALFEMSMVRKEKSLAQQRVHELESKMAEAEAATAAAQAGERLHLEKWKALQHQISTSPSSPSSSSQQYFQPGHDSDTVDRQMQLEMEMEEVHEKMSSLRDAARAKDMFLTTLSEQVETYRNGVEEKEREIRRIKADSERHSREKDRLLLELKEVETKWLAHGDCSSKESFDKLRSEFALAKEKYAQESKEARERISQLQDSVDELKRAGMESLELYESSVEMNRVDREAMNASLADERRRVSSLELEREDLRKAGLDAIEAYEATIEEMKKDRAAQFEDHAHRRDTLQSTIETLKQEIDQLIMNVETEEKHAILKDVWESERKRLTDQIEALEHDKISHEALKVETEILKDQSKESERLLKEKSKLEEQLARLQSDYDDQLASRTKYLDEVRSAVESQKKTQAELRRLTETKEKLERDLLLQQEQQQQQQEQPAVGGDEKLHQLEIDTFRSEIEKLQAQNAMLLKQKEQAEQEKQDVTQYQHLISSLKSDNKKWQKDHGKLEEANKKMEVECMKLMEEVEKLHGQVISQDEMIKLDPTDQATLLLQQNQKKLEKLTIEHTTELRKTKEKGEAVEKEQKRQIAMLNRDISELESLIESKIFKEADLEEALEKERKEVSKLKLMIEDAKEDKKHKSSLASPPTSIVKSHHSNEPYCEICEVVGHDLISCKAVSLSKGDLERPYCENCEEFGLHFTKKCPNQNETY
ncbi:hypothetical protein INT47_001159 [Mucor saturninus]|uniref:CAP-Gly domain-containing protein n=1 Tax=Mucor saturninus TaxID=64648 RepID=A0A8H7VB31_9FUNG|nr:hypothetical protein INT47_001159 [Mucor saturninus]